MNIIKQVLSKVVGGRRGMGLTRLGGQAKWRLRLRSPVFRVGGA